MRSRDLREMHLRLRNNQLAPSTASEMLKKVRARERAIAFADAHIDDLLMLCHATPRNVKQGFAA